MATYKPYEIAVHRLELKKCAESFAYWVDTYGMMWIKEGGDPIEFKLWEFQQDAAEKFQNNMKLVVLKARQMGLSWLVSAYTLWKVMFNKNFHAYYTSIGLKEVNEQTARIRFIYDNLPEWMQEGRELGGKDCKNNDSIMEFTNKSAIHQTASGKSAGHGSAPGLFVCDEWARVENAMEKWRAIKPSLGRRSQVFLISTSDGLGNHFSEMWHSAVAGENNFLPVFYSCLRHPEYTEEFLENAKADFAGDMQGYMQAYPRTPEDAFMATSRRFFPQDAISAAKEYLRLNRLTPTFGYIDVDEEGKRFIHPDNASHFMFWKEPEEGHQYAMGADVALGIIGGDWSVAIVIDTDTREVVAMYRAKIVPEEYSLPLLHLAKFYNNAWLCVEVNTASEIIMADLKAEYPWLYRREQRKQYSDLPTLELGFYTSATSKPRILTNMRRQFCAKEKPLRVYSDTILDEMLVFEQSEGLKLGAPKGMHDDCVMATALALEAETTMPWTGDWSMSRGIVEQEHRDWRSL